MHACMHVCMDVCNACHGLSLTRKHALPSSALALPWHHLAKSEIKGTDWGKTCSMCLLAFDGFPSAPTNTTFKCWALELLRAWVHICFLACLVPMEVIWIEVQCDNRISKTEGHFLSRWGHQLNQRFWTPIPGADRIEEQHACMHACMISFQTKQPLQFAKKIWVTSWGSECKKEAHACSEIHEHIFTQPVKMSRCMPPRMEFTRSSCMHERYSRLRWISAQMLPLVWSPHP